MSMGVRRGIITMSGRRWSSFKNGDEIAGQVDIIRIPKVKYQR